MEAGWVQDTFMKNDFLLDRARTTYVNNCGISSEELIDQAVDVYVKKIDDKKSIYRVIMLMGNVKTKTVQVGDGYVNKNGMELTFDKQSIAKLVPVNDGLPNDVKNLGGEVQKAVFDTPILNEYYLIKKGGKTLVYQQSNGQNGAEEVMSYNF